MKQDTLQSEDKEALKDAYIGYHSPWNEVQEKEKYAIIIKQIWSKYSK